MIKLCPVAVAVAVPSIGTCYATLSRSTATGLLRYCYTATLRNMG
jgi:hypothetical protein